MTGSFIDDLRDVPGLNEFRHAPKDQGLRVTGEDPDGDFDGADDLTEKKEVETFPCEQCGGSGVYRGVRRHQPETRCFACGGKGYFKKSYKDRLASRAKRAARKADKLTSAKSDFEQMHPNLIERMKKLATWNNFVADLLTKFEQYGSLSDNQVAAVERQIEKANARDAQRNAEREARIANAPVVNTEALKVAFAAASSNGLKKPILRYEGFTVSQAPATGKNAGALYVKAGADYLGKIVDGKYQATWEAQRVEGLIAKVAEAMNDPLAAAIAYGRRTGACSCCGRKLTDPTSVHNGIGPICADKYGWVLEAPTTEEVREAVAPTAPRSTKYEYAPDMTDAEKRKMRAAARRAARV